VHKCTTASLPNSKRPLSSSGQGFKVPSVKLPNASVHMGEAQKPRPGNTLDGDGGALAVPENANVAARPALPKRGVAPSFPPVREPLFEGPAKDAVVAQLVRAPVCGTGGRWFEPTQLYHYAPALVVWTGAVLVAFGTFWSSPGTPTSCNSKKPSRAGEPDALARISKRTGTLATSS
jgi:hypothetical protein